LAEDRLRGRPPVAELLILAMFLEGMGAELLEMPPA
jgi:hypothetical protein